MSNKIPVLEMTAEFEFKEDYSFIGSKGKKGSKARITGFRLNSLPCLSCWAHDKIPEFRVEGIWKNSKWLHASMFTNAGEINVGSH